MERIARKWLNLFFPNRCVLCKQFTANRVSLCNCCANDLNYFDYRLFDDLMLQPNINQGIKNPRFDRLVCLAPYHWPFNQWITDMKFRENYAVADLMAQQLVKLLQNLLDKNPSLIPEVILPMPIHRNRRFTRGYNQSQLIATVIAKTLKIPLDSQSLIRVKSTPAQSGLDKSARKTNVKQAFSYHGAANLHVALIDDVITTGATVNEVCKELKKRGVKQVSVWTICATPQSSKTIKGQKR